MARKAEQGVAVNGELECGVEVGRMGQEVAVDNDLECEAVVRRRS